PSSVQARWRLPRPSPRSSGCFCCVDSSQRSPAGDKRWLPLPSSRSSRSSLDLPPVWRVQRCPVCYGRSWPTSPAPDSSSSEAIAGAAVILGRRSLSDVPTMLIALVTLALLITHKKIPEPVLILAAGLVGLLLRSQP